MSFGATIRLLVYITMSVSLYQSVCLLLSLSLFLSVSVSVSVCLCLSLSVSLSLSFFQGQGGPRSALGVIWSLVDLELLLIDLELLVHSKPTYN